jgi:hypothetical protein
MLRKETVDRGSGMTEDVVMGRFEVDADAEEGDCGPW